MSRYESIGKSFYHNKMANKEMVRLLRDFTLKDDTPYHMFTFGLKQCLGTGYEKEYIDPNRAKQNMKHFIRTLNRKIYGNNFKRTKYRIISLPVLEYSDGNRFHYHVLIRFPSNIDWHQFIELVTKLWAKTMWGQPRVHVSYNCDVNVINYLTKFKTDRCQIDEMNQNWF